MISSKLLLLLIVFNLTSTYAAISPMDLRCENRVNPLGIDETNPLLSWKISSEARNIIQSAYEIMMAEGDSSFENDAKIFWSTGKISSSESANIRYSGNALKPGIRYYWRVRIYDQDGNASAWSATAWFETGLQPNDWQAKWIGDGSSIPEKDEDAYLEDPMPLFRKTFSTGKKIKNARIYISGVGYYEAYLNGKKIGDSVLDPGWTTYSKQVLYAVHDVTSLINNGSNVIGVMLGNGWWNPLPFKLFGRWAIRDYQQTGRPCFKAELHLNFTDGSTERIITDENWTTMPGPIVRNNVYLGEYYDARREVDGWNKQNTKGKWTQAKLANGPDGRLTSQMQPPIRVTRTLKPVSIREQSKGVYIVDFGQNFAGVTKLRVKGKAGTTVRIRYGEGLFEDGSLNVMTSVATQIKKGGIKGGPGAPETAWQEDRYILKGKGTEVWSPRFTFHAFQFIEVTGWPGKPSLEDFEGLRMNADLEETGNFSCSNDMFNKLHEVIQWTFLSNVFSVQSDCPGREKFGYGADLVVSSNAFIYNYDMSNFYRKAIQDFANDQQDDGGITELSPFIGIADRGYGGNSGPLGWQLAFPFLQQQLFDYYGDRRIVERQYKNFRKQLSFLEEHAVDGLYHWDISDHEALDPRPEAFSASAFYYHHALVGAQFAGLMKQAEDSIKYAKLAERIKRLIVRKYNVPGTGRFDNGTQSAQILALWYDLSPENDLTYKALLDEFERHNWHVSSGIFGVKMMFDVLRDRQQNEIAYRVANQRDFPGWGYMLENGATTLWESWEFPETSPSRNHPMFGSIDEWFYRSLLGINPAAPGFKKILLKPQPAGDLKWAKGSYKSIYGEIVSDWKIENGKFLYKVNVPPNTTAEVHIPSTNGSVQADGRPLKDITCQNGFCIVKVGSGAYTFETTYRQ